MHLVSNSLDADLIVEKVKSHHRMCGVVGGDVNPRYCYKGCVRDVVFRRGKCDVYTSCNDALWTTGQPPGYAPKVANREE